MDHGMNEPTPRPYPTGTPTQFRVQVILDNGKGQGGFGLGPDLESALGEARRQFRAAIGARPPKRFRVMYRASRMDLWSAVVEEEKFRSWKALTATAQEALPL